ncbi:MAG: MazG family protein [Solirubrobacterales bacterium]|nr:MazG family protein [Solirubrobacterales bacterium]
MPAQDAAAPLVALDELTRRLRAECPWDREQDARSIVPHTVEEAYELADAANTGDDSKLLDELGDVLFQVHFLSLLLEERGAGSLAEVAEHVHRKLVSRHPHVFGAVEVADATEVLANWDEIKKDEAGREPGIFGEVPENLPGPLYARKVQRRAKTAGLRVDPEPVSATAGALETVDPEDRDAAFTAVGDALFAGVDAARRLRVDPEIALRAAADRFRARVERAEKLGETSGTAWETLSDDQRRDLYAQASKP